jgi:NAD(P)-dependent dehydrogenase (short-subunit alcohol dehydrogenase family)
MTAGTPDREVGFAGDVVLITGAGRGLGRSYALLIASLGAVIAVHDGGVDQDGTGSDPEPARSVCEEITAAGGTASAHTQTQQDDLGAEATPDALLNWLRDAKS